MTDSKTINKNITELSVLEALTRIYAEVAALKMNKTRSQVLLSREFLTEINDLFEEVRASYAHEIAELIKKKKTNKGITFLSHNGKKVAVLLSSNTGLYGEISNKTFRAFITDIKSGSTIDKPEVTIVGKQGLSLFQSEQPDEPYTYFEISDDQFDAGALAQVINHIVQYEEITLYFGKYQSVIHQSAEKLHITAQTDVYDKLEKKVPQYIFEPDLERILMFFETEIFASLFEQTMRESQLARYASRILAMQQAGDNIKKSYQQLRFESLRLTHSLANKKQLNSLSGVFAQKQW